MSRLAVPLLLAAQAAAGTPALAQAQAVELEARVWLDRAEEPVLQRGDQVRVYYRTSETAYAAIFRIDTDGLVSMVFPQHPGATAPMRGGRDYRLLFPRSPVWSVQDDPGVGYFFIVASPEPLDFSTFGYDLRTGWELDVVGRTVYEDPYVAIDDYVAQIVPDWEAVPYALDFLTYHVGNTYSYPRFLCYDCHTPQPYTTWNPYSAVCTSFRVVIWDDPYFYPSYRYSGTRVVVARPARTLPRYGVRTRVQGDIGVRPLVLPRTPPERRVVRFKEAPAVSPSSRVPVRRGSTSPTARTAQQARQRSEGSGVEQTGLGGAPDRPTLQRRPSGRLPARSPGGASAAGTPRTGAASATPRRGPAARERRPASGSEPRATPTRVPTGVPTGVPTRAAPARRPATSGRAPPTARGTNRPARTTRRPAARPGAPNRPSAGRAPGRASAGPAPSRPRARPTPRPPGRATARPAPAPRQPSSRPTVRARGGRRGN